ncbi:MAG: hypothetical protein AAFN10_05860 [Bacteroidota bacterium]
MSTTHLADQHKKEFRRILVEFGRVMLLGLLLVIVAGYFWRSAQPQELYVYCDAERVRTRLGKPAFVNEDQAFTGGVLQSKEQAHQGHYSARLSATAQFALETRIPNLTGEEEIVIRIWRYIQDSKGEGASLIAEIPGTKGGMVNTAKHTEEDWELLELRLLPDCRHANQYLKVYCWNPTGQVVYFDDLEIRISPVY